MIVVYQAYTTPVTPTVLGNAAWGNAREYNRDQLKKLDGIPKKGNSKNRNKK